MNAESAPPGAPAAIHEPIVARCAARSLGREIERLRCAIQYALDDLENGNAWSAVDVLLAALDDVSEARCAA